MELTLFYRGPLVPKGKPNDKQRIRNEFHPQLLRAIESSRALRSTLAARYKLLADAWEKSIAAEGSGADKLERKVFTAHDGFLGLRGFMEEYGRNVKGYKFIPLAGPEVSTLGVSLVDLDITWLRTGSPGKLFHEGGDIDNRLKTLFDALSVPTKEQVSGVITEEPDLLAREPMYCLVDDDELIANVNIKTAELLDVDEARPEEVVLLIKATIHDTRLDGIS